jgi:hypothetical protein
MEVGDKVFYIGDDHPSLYINKQGLYTIKILVNQHGGLELKEIERLHSYWSREFRKATTEEIINYYNEKEKERCSI